MLCYIILYYIILYYIILYTWILYFASWGVVNGYLYCPGLFVLHSNVTRINHPKQLLQPFAKSSAFLILPFYIFY